MNLDEISNLLNRVMDLETNGYEFYMECARHTGSKEGADMFRYLAGEEQSHYRKVSRIYRICQEEFNRGYRKHKVISKTAVRGEEPTDLFWRNVRVGNLDEKSDSLDALNTGIKAEKDSIVMYGKLSKMSSVPETVKLFEQLIKEEKRHLSILEIEAEFITETGTFYDFRVITS